VRRPNAALRLYLIRGFCHRSRDKYSHPKLGTYFVFFSPNDRTSYNSHSFYSGKLSCNTIASLARSPRFLALLSRRSLNANPTMGLTVVPQGYPPLEEKKPLKEPPPVVITPCDPWPRPYFLENGLRRVAPYHYTYNTYCKERWRGRELLDIFASEFRDRPLEYYVCRIWHGFTTYSDRPRKMPLNEER
jgi:hypothetical protein